MKAKEIKELIDFISSSGLDQVNIETEAFKIRVKRSPDQPHTPLSSPPPTPMRPSPATPLAPPDTTFSPASADQPNLVPIHSPMIGTFYRSVNPESAPFVSVGDEITKGKTVCIIEAMKLFNEIESEVSGKIVKVLVDNASPVEYDQPLFLVEPL